MHASGLFFLRHTPHPCRQAADGAPGVLLPLCERDGPIVRHITAVWMGQAACDWLAQHTGRLHAGTALALQLSHLRAHGGEIHAHVQTCALAPARWPSRRAGQPAAPATHAHPVAHHPV